MSIRLDPLSSHAPVTRRRFLHAGGISTLGLLFPGFLDKTASATTTNGPTVTQPHYIRPIAGGARDPGKSLILIVLQGGASHFDTFDPRTPGTDSSIKGPFERIETSARGIYITEPFQRLSRLIDKVKVVRNLYHNDSGHPSATSLMLTGDPSVNPPASDFYTDSRYPSPLKELTTHLFNTGNPVSDYVVLHHAELPVPNNITPFEWPLSGTNARTQGTLYSSYNHQRQEFPNPFSGTLDPVRFRERETLLDAFNDSAFFPPSESATRFDALQRQARARLNGNLRHAFNLSTVPAPIRDKYGRNQFGDMLLMAKKLVEAGSRVVVVNVGHFDHHYIIGTHLGRLLPPLDRALSALIQEIEMLDLPIVGAVVSEFGRTPRVNSSQGRDHWPNSNSMLLFGQGIEGGEIIGQTRNDGIIQGNALDASLVGESLLRKIGFARYVMRATVRTNEEFPHLNI